MGQQLQLLMPYYCSVTSWWSQTCTSMLVVLLFLSLNGSRTSTMYLMAGSHSNMKESLTIIFLVSKTTVTILNIAMLFLLQLSTTLITQTSMTWMSWYPELSNSPSRSLDTYPISPLRSEYFKAKLLKWRISLLPRTWHEVLVTQIFISAPW